jgi:hypothetical protein
VYFYICDSNSDLIHVELGLNVCFIFHLWVYLKPEENLKPERNSKNPKPEKIPKKLETQKTSKKPEKKLESNTFIKPDRHLNPTQNSTDSDIKFHQQI